MTTTRHIRSLWFGTALTASLAGSQLLAQGGDLAEALAQRSAEILPFSRLDPATRAADRHAIVIGNGAYKDVADLRNAVADSRAVADLMRAQGYQVSHYEDITKLDFEAVLRRALFDVDRDTEVVVFYAGHGFQIGSENYLVPTDADLDDIYDLPFEAVSLGALVGIIGARARLQIVILDSCRDNPFAGRQALTQFGTDLREAETGFVSQPAPLNSMLVFSTAPGSVAYDGEGTNSHFTAAFVEKVVDAPDALVKDIFEQVRLSVWNATGGAQLPWDSSTLIEPASFGIEAVLERPPAVSSFGMGQTRGMGRVTEPSAGAPETVQAVQGDLAIEADFVPEVLIGPSLVEALGPMVQGDVRIVQGPEMGRLLLDDTEGFARDVTGRPLTREEVGRLVLANRSVQVRAEDLGDPLLTDRLTLSLGDRELGVELRLSVDPCDFAAGDRLDPDGMGVTRYPNEIEGAVALAACDAAIAREPDVGRFHHQRGRALLALARLDEAGESFRRGMELGHARSWNAYGSMFALRDRTTGGLDRQPFPEEALVHIARGVEEGDPYAMYALGRQFLRYGDSRDVQIEGYDLMMRSIEVGHTYAMNELASYYFDPESEYHNPDRALRYLEESAARQDIYGINALGIAHWRGRGSLEPDFTTAFELFARATAEGHPTAPFNLARMYRDGEAPGGVDMKAAVDNFVLALSAGHALSGANAAYFIWAEQPEGYDLYDAAIYGAKGAALSEVSGAESSFEQIAAMPADMLEGGIQKLMIEAGAEDLTVTGSLSAEDTAMLSAMLDQEGLGPLAETPVDRIVQAAKVFWVRSPLRVDLF